MTDEREEVTLHFPPAEGLTVARDLYAALADDPEDDTITLTQGDRTIEVGTPGEAAELARQLLANAAGSPNLDRAAYEEALDAYETWRQVDETRRKQAREARKAERELRIRALLARE